MKRIFEIIDFESDESNFKISFKDITRKYGREYRDFCQAAWQANGDCLTEEEFMKINGDMPVSFFEKVVKK